MGAEKNFENRIKNLLKLYGCYFLKYWGGGQFTKTGVPDILCCCEGHFMGIEVKSSTGKPSPLQIHNLKEINESGGIALLLYPNDWSTFAYMMQLLKRNDDLWVYEYDRLKERWMKYE